MGCICSSRPEMQVDREKYLKLLFPNVQRMEGITPREFKRYCFDRARRMRDTIKYQLGLLDVEYAGKDLPPFKIYGIDAE